MKKTLKEQFQSDQKFRIKVIGAAVLFILLLAACVYTVGIRPNLNKETYVYKEEEVSRGDLILGIMESGSLSFTQEQISYDLNLSLIYDDDDDDDDDSDSDDDDDDDDDEDANKYLEIDEVYAVSGQRVSEGEALFSLTEDSVAAVRRKISSALAEAQIRLSEAKTQYNISLLTAQSTYDSSVTEGNRASADYEAALSKSEAAVTSIEGQIEILQLQIKQAQEALADEDFLDSISDAYNSYVSAKSVYDETDVHNATAYLSNRTKYESAKETYENLIEQKETYQETIDDNTAEIAELQQDLADAKTEKVLDDQEAKNTYESSVLTGELAEDVYAYSTQSLQDSVTQAQTTVDELQSLMEDFETFVGDDGVVYAPEEGLLISVNCEEGDELTNESTLIAYSTNEDTVTIDVSEEDIAAISVGSSVDIVFTAYPDETFTGTVTSITTTASSEYSATISYPIVIRVEGDTDKLYEGMTADVTFVTDSVTDVLYVSKKAVFEEDGKKYVYRKTESGSMEQTEVETGFEDMSSVEITSGLSEGDTVYLKSLMTESASSESDTDTTTETESENGTGSDTNAPSGDFENGDFGGDFDPGNFDGGSFSGGDFPGNGGFGN